MDLSKTCFIPFSEDLSRISLPEKFTYPFYYEPHPLSVLAATKLQAFLEKEAPAFGWEFGLTEAEASPRGRMFGVLIVKNQEGTLGYLAAFSGNTGIAEKGFPFVPAVFDFWEEDGFYVLGVKEFESLSQRITEMEQAASYLQLQADLARESKESAAAIADLQMQLKIAKTERDEQRSKAEAWPEAEKIDLLQRLEKESLDQHYHFKRTKKEHKARLEALQAAVKDWETEIESLKLQRKNLSNTLQETIYKGFQFLNIAGEQKGLDEIFADTVLKQPPSGAGECAAPRLLQYAFLQGLQPIAMAEFWWGASSKSEIRFHKEYYPACRGKCQPILAHMLKGIELETSPIQQHLATEKDIEILYEDDALLVIVKPFGLLSVPGKEVEDSVYTRLRALFPQAEGPLVAHRLDMDTSGLMLIAKSMEVYKALQAQFIQRKVRKRYAALLEGIINEEEGLIELPLSSDFLNRPRQIVDFEAGKEASTRWKVLKRFKNRTLVHFFPLTGRTHQLRVHAAHQEGLNCPIVGDDLYGRKDKRLCLHAEWIEFEHPILKRKMSFEKKAEF